MAASRRYKALGRRLAHLKKHHLAFASRLAGNYTERQLLQAAAYTVFAHAEFEVFIEEWAAEILNRINTRGHGAGASPMLGHLMAYRAALSQPQQMPTNNNGWQTHFNATIQAHLGVIKNSHGIREINICRILIPLGFDVTLIDNILVNDLDAFASIRGNHAHQSIRTHLGQLFDPFDRETKVQKIYTLLLPVDEALQAHLKAC
jgi:hypothetical protein